MGGRGAASGKYVSYPAVRYETGGGSTKGLSEYKEYEYGLDSEFKQALGTRLYNKVTNAKSTAQVVSAFQNSGFKINGSSNAANYGRDNRISMYREKNNVIEQISINTTEGYYEGKRRFYLNSMYFVYHK